MPGRSETRDAGVTLVELLIVVLLGSLIVGTLGATITLFLRTEQDAPARLVRNKAPQGLAAFLQSDVNSTPPGGWNLDDAEGRGGPPNPEVCGTYLPGDNILRLRWDEVLGNGITEFVVSYRSVEEAEDQWQLVRYSCERSGARSASGVVYSAYSAPSVVEVSPELLQKPAASALTGEGLPDENSLLKQITVTLVGRDPGNPATPRPYSITATRLNAELGLCRASAFVLDRDEVALNPDGTLAEPVAVTVTLRNRPETTFDDVARNCPTSFRLEFSTGSVNTDLDDPIRAIRGVRTSTGGTDPVHTVSFTLTAGPFEANPEAFTWTPGLWGLTLREFGNSVPGPVVGTGAVRTTGLEDCTLVSMSTGLPDGTDLVPGGLLVSSDPGSEGQILRPFEVRIATAGLCAGPLRLGFDPSGDVPGTSTPWGAYEAVEMESTDAPINSTWRFVFEPNEAGTRPELFDPDPSLASPASPPTTCTATITEAPAAITLDADRSLATPLTVRVAVSGTCSTPDLASTPGLGTPTRVDEGGGVFSFTYPDDVADAVPLGTAAVALEVQSGTAPVARATVGVDEGPGVIGCVARVEAPLPDRAITLLTGDSMPSGQTVTVAQAGTGCGSPWLRYERTAGAVATIPMARSGSLFVAELPAGETWTPGSSWAEILDSEGATAPMASQLLVVAEPDVRPFTWDALSTDHRFTFREANGDPVVEAASTLYVVQRAIDQCTVGTPVVTTPPEQIRLRTLNTGVLRTPLVVTVTASRYCADLELRATVSGNVGDLERVWDGSAWSPTEWIGSFTGQPNWRAGQDTIVVSEAGGDAESVPPATIQIINPCAVTAPPEVTARDTVPLRWFNGYGQLTEDVTVRLTIAEDSMCTSDLFMLSDEATAAPVEEEFRMEKALPVAFYEFTTENWDLGEPGEVRAIGLTFEESTGEPIVDAATGFPAEASLSIIRPACLISNVRIETPPPAPGELSIQRAPNVSNTRTREDLLVTVETKDSTDEACRALQVSFAPPPVSGDLSVLLGSLAQGSVAGTYTGQVGSGTRWGSLVFSSTTNTAPIVVTVTLSGGTPIFTPSDFTARGV